jgi:hypothetical protein
MEFRKGAQTLLSSITHGKKGGEFFSVLKRSEYFTVKPETLFTDT